MIMSYDLLSFFMLNDYSFGLPNSFEKYTIYDLKLWSYIYVYTNWPAAQNLTKKNSKHFTKLIFIVYTLNDDASLDIEAWV